MLLTANREICIGSGKCVVIAPEVFDQDDEGLVVLTKERLDDGSTAAVIEAIQLCPVLALTVEPSPDDAQSS